MAKTSPHFRRILEKLLNEASVTNEIERRDELLADARQAVADCLTRGAEDPVINYLAGLTMYKSFCADEQYGTKAEFHLRKAIALDSADQFARLFLGHYYYDTERFGEALEYFQSVDESYFRSIDQLWRVLTLHELIICCRVFLEDPQLTIDDFDLLVEEFLSTPLIDVPIPFQIVICLAKTKNAAIWNVLDRAKIQVRIAAMIDAIDLPDEFKENARPALT